MQYARNHPKQHTFIGGIARKQSLVDSALSQMRAKVGLVINNNTLCGFEGEKICPVETRLVNYDGEGRTTKERGLNHVYSMCLLKQLCRTLSEKIQSIIKNNLKENKTLDQELRTVRVVSFGKAKNLLKTRVRLNQTELSNWYKISSCPFRPIILTS